MNLPLTNGCLYISSSFLDTFNACPRAGQYYKIDGKVAASSEAALIFGSHLHTALELHYRQQEFGSSQEVISQKVMAVLTDEFAKRPTPEEDFRNLNWALELYQRYAKKFSQENWQLMKYKEAVECEHCSGNGSPDLSQEHLQPCHWCNGTGKTSIMTEVPFAVKLFDYVNPDKRACAHNEVLNEPLPVYYHGIIDLPIYLDGKPWIMDFKSGTRIDASFWNSQKRSGQYRGYAWALQQTLGIEVAGYLVRALRVLEPPKYVQEGKPKRGGGEYKNVADWWDESFPEEKEYLNQDDIAEWKHDTIANIEEFLWHYSRGYFPQKRNACHAKYKCSYFDICSTFPASDRGLILNSGLYKTKEPNQKIK